MREMSIVIIFTFHSIFICPYEYKRNTKSRM